MQAGFNSAFWRPLVRQIRMICNCLKYRYGIVGVDEPPKETDIDRYKMVKGGKVTYGKTSLS